MLVWLFLLVVLVACAGVEVAGAQELPGLEREFASLFSRIPSLSGILEGEMPGITRPDAPMILPPIFRAEFRVRPLFINFSGDVSNGATGQSLSLLDDLGHIENAVVIESMARLKVSRFSLRAHVDSYMRTFRGGTGRFDWPEWRVGGDLDLIDTPNFRFGLNMDFYWDQPSFNFGNVGFGPVSIPGPRPSTWGLHAVLDLGDPRSIRYSLETRGRLSMRTGSRIDEVEAALGLMSPETVFGSVLLRGGYRHTWLEINWEGSQVEVQVQWSGVFADLSYRF